MTMTSSTPLLTASPASVGLDESAVVNFLDGLVIGGFDPHHVLIVVDDVLVARADLAPYAAGMRHMTHSMTKSFTGAGVGLAIHDGLLSLDDRVLDHFSELADGAPAHLRTMRVRDLLTMTSGHDRGHSGSEWRSIPGSWVPEFMKIPVPMTPGEHFQYSSAPSFMLSALVGRVTGGSLHGYVRDRLLEPMGVCGEEWDADPTGVSSGGNGLLITPEDVAKLGVLHLRGGVWQGERLLPEEWVHAATTPRVEFPPERRGTSTYEPEARGYGYHFWMGPDDAYYASGFFGQYCIVLPESDAVIVINAGADPRRAHLMLPLVWGELRPHLASRPPSGQLPSTASSPAIDSPAGLDRATVMSPGVCQNADVELATSYTAAPNDDGLEELAVHAQGDRLLVRLVHQGVASALECGVGHWVTSRATLPGLSLHHGYEMPDAPVACSARWASSEELVVTCVFLETAFTDELAFVFDGDSVQYTRSVNTNMGALSRPVITATASDGTGVR